MTRPTDLTHALALLALAAGATACERPSGAYDLADRPEPPPVSIGEVAAPTGGGGAKSSGLTPEQAALCGRGTGRTPDGECVGLTLVELEHVQRVQIPAGEFVMGHIPSRYDTQASREAPAVRWSGQPPRYVNVGSFWIDLHEVSRAAYSECVGAGACTPATCLEGQEDPIAEVSEKLAVAFPQTCVTHEQARSYCAFTGARLPTEAEWEYAARGPDARFFPWGNEVLDELLGGLYPVGRVREDMSYFGILGMGSNAVEWVADRYDPDAGLRPFLSGEFRDPAGPSARAREAWERALACGDPPAPGCAASEAARERFVLKVSVAGARRAARALAPAHPPEAELEGWAEVAQHPGLGFRCAADLVPGRDTPLTVPAATAPIPFTRSEGALEIFGGIAEAASQAEARRFCELLVVPGADPQNPRTGWRLPTHAEVVAIAASFRGPGPFWAEDAAILQEDGTSFPGADAPWVTIEAGPDEALAARCVR